MFLLCVLENFLFQHITEHTRVREANTSSILQLVFTYMRQKTGGIIYGAHPGKCHHTVFKFEYIISKKITKESNIRWLFILRSCSFMRHTLMYLMPDDLHVPPDSTWLVYILIRKHASVDHMIILSSISEHKCCYWAVWSGLEDKLWARTKKCCE